MYLTIKEIDIKIRSQPEIKEMLKQKIKKKAYDYLMSLTDKHTKTRKELYSNKLEISQYFIDNRFNAELSQITFMFRTRMFKVKNNFRNKYANVDIKCIFCENEDETQDHIYKCSNIINIMGPLNCNHEDLFSKDVNTVYKAALKTKEIIELRELLLNP